MARVRVSEALSALDEATSQLKAARDRGRASNASEKANIDKATAGLAKARQRLETIPKCGDE